MSKSKITLPTERSPVVIQAMREAARLHAQANTSDPFAYAVIMSRMLVMGPEAGYSPGLIKGDAERVIKASQMTAGASRIQGVKQ